MNPTEFFSSDHYLAINKARQDHFLSLGLPLKGKTVFEPGAGIGHNTVFLREHGAIVHPSEARAANRDEFLVGPQIYNVDVNADDLTNLGKFDVVFCYGLLYHLPDPSKVIKKLANVCTGYMAVETVVSPKIGDWSYPYQENKEEPGNGLSGMGCRPTREFMLRNLLEHFDYAYVPATQPVHQEFPLNWDHEFTEGLQRAVFIGSHKEIVHPKFLTHLPKVQYYHETVLRS